MRAKLTNINHCAVLFFSRAAVNLCWYCYNKYFVRIKVIVVKYDSLTLITKMLIGHYEPTISK